MCLAVYIRCSAPLATIAWHDDSPSFYLEEIEDLDSVACLRQGARLYYAGSSEGCGCGFKRGDSDAVREERVRRDYAALSACVARAFSADGTVDLYARWEGDEGLPLQSRTMTTAAEIASEGFELIERRLYRLGAKGT